MSRLTSTCRAIARAVPPIVGKQNIVSLFNYKIIAMYARGMTARETQEYLLIMYGTEVSPDFTGRVTDKVKTELPVAQLALEPMYPSCPSMHFA